MLRFAVILSLFVSVYGITGGEDAQAEDIPYQAALKLGGSTVCGGSIISADVIVTSASCGRFADERAWTILVGRNKDDGGKVLTVKKIINHEDFDSSSYENNISLFFLNNPLDLNDSATQPLALPNAEYIIPDGTLAMASGWGVANNSFPRILQKLIISTMEQQSCVTLYKNLGWKISESMMCAGGPKGGGYTGQGDNGGPLAVNSTLIGIASFGIGVPDQPTVWVRVPALIAWIQQNM